MNYEFWYNEFMIYLSLGCFFACIAVLYFLAKEIIKNIYRFFYYLSGKKKPAIEGLCFLILPGTIIHELSHMFLAAIMGVETGPLSFRPEIEESKEVKIGQIKIAKTDPFRRTIIGLAPLFAGLLIIGGIFNFYLEKRIWPLTQLLDYSLWEYLLLLIACWLMVVVSLTMFSSRKDLDSAIVPAVVLTVLIVIFWLAGFRLTMPKKFIDLGDSLLVNMDKALALAIVLGLGALVFFKGLNSAYGKILRR